MNDDDDLIKFILRGQAAQQAVNAVTERHKMKFGQLDDAQLKRMSDGYCCDCGHRGFVLGPRGGMSINIECGGCRNRFNVASSSHSHRFLWGQRIERVGNWNEERR